MPQGSRLIYTWKRGGKPMNLDEFRKMFAKAPEKFPSGLEQRYSRVLTQMLAKWETPLEMEAYLNELVVDKRGNRQGFPQDILKEILFIAQLFEKWRAERKRKASSQILANIGPGLVDSLDKSQKTVDEEMSREFRGLKLKLQRDDAVVFSGLDLLLNQRDKDGMTPLMHAACYGAEKSMIHMLKMGANPHMADPGGNRPLHWAVTMNRLRAVEILMYFGAEPNVKNNSGITPLALAAIKPDPTVASRLVDYGAEVNLPDGKGDFPLHKAVMSGSSEGVRFLLAAGALRDMRNRDGKAPLDLNVSNHAEEVLRAFHSHQSDLLKSTMSGERRG